MKDEVISLIAEVLEIDKEKINENTNLLKDLEVESLDLVDLIVAFENKYNFDIPDQDIKDLITVGDIINYIQEHYV